MAGSSSSPLLYLMRHGQTDWNRAGRLQGHTDTALNREGIRQAKRSAAVLAHLPFSNVHSSDLTRARMTAEPHAQMRELEVQISASLRETMMGPAEGLVLQEYLAKYGDRMSIRDSLPFEQRFNFRMHPEMETYAESYQRILQYLEQASEQAAGSHVLLVTHGGVIRVLIMAMHQHLIRPTTRNTGYVAGRLHQGRFLIEEMRDVTLI